MLTHDPSTCPRCRWAAEREGRRLGKPGFYLDEDGSPLRSLCTSLDAVSGLIKELARQDWALAWNEAEQQWACYNEWDRNDEYLSEDYSCVIDAARAVLGKGNKDD